MKNESKTFKTGKLQKVGNRSFYLIDMGFLIPWPFLSLLLTESSISSCLSDSHEQTNNHDVCVIFIK